jgi:hypothetical protein
MISVRSELSLAFLPKYKSTLFAFFENNVVVSALASGKSLRVLRNRVLNLQSPSHTIYPYIQHVVILR